MEKLSEKPGATYINMLLHGGRGCLCSASYELICQHGKTDVQMKKIMKSQNEEHVQVPLAFVQVFHGQS